MRPDVSAGADSAPALEPTDLVGSRAAGPVAARGGAMRAAGYAAATLIAVGSAPLMIRHLGVVGFGQYVTVLALVVFVAGFTDAGITTIALREFATRSGRDREDVMRDLLAIRIVLALLAIVISVAFALVAGYPHELVVGAAAMGAGMLLQSVQLLLGVGLQGELRFGWITIVDVLRQVIFVAAVVALVVAGAGLEPFFFAQIPACAITLVIVGLLVRGVMPLLPSFRPRRWLPLVRDTLTYAAALALNSAYFRIAIIALSLLATEQETGYFATAFRVIESLIALPALFIGAAFPILSRAARDDRERLDYATTRLLEVALIVGLWIALTLALGARPVVQLLAGHESDPSIGLLRLQSFALVGTFIAVAGGFALLSLHSHRAMLLANVAALATSISLSLALIPGSAATGAAVAVLAAELALAAAVLFALLRERPAVAAALRRAPPILLAAALTGLVALVPAVPDIARAVLGAAAFPALLVAVHRFPPEVADALRGRAREEPA